MLWLTLIVAFGIGGVALAFVLWPILRPDQASVLIEDDRLTELMGAKDAALGAIKELEFDHQMGKLSEEDFERFNLRLRRQAMGLLQQIEKMAPQTAALDDPLEAQIARLRKVTGTSPHSAPALPEATVVHAQPSSADGHARFCTECGAALAAQHKFCAACGTPVIAHPMAAGD